MKLGKLEVHLKLEKSKTSWRYLHVWWDKRLVWKLQKNGK